MESTLVQRVEDLSVDSPLSLHDEYSGNGAKRFLVGTCFDGDDQPELWPAWAYVRRMWDRISREVSENEDNV